MNCDEMTWLTCTVIEADSDVAVWEETSFLAGVSHK